MGDPALSVVIPTRNRCSILLSTLKALDSQQGLDGSLEVIVVDDGSADNTSAMLSAANFTGFELIPLALRHGGPARARNSGISQASADRILLLGDDTVPNAGALAHHVKADSENHTAIQGRIDWDNSWATVTPVMEFLAPEGPQFYFRGLSEGSPVPFWATVSSNLSAPKQWFLDDPFDERFTAACMEDTELAYRWNKRHRPVIFSDRASCRHRHRYDSIEPVLARQYSAGRWARFAVGLHPELISVLILKPLIFGAAAAFRQVVRWPRERQTQRDSWNLMCRWAYVRGFFGSDYENRS
jgi:glycosyltransferase involved in cell wall biosynthesis